MPVQVYELGLEDNGSPSKELSYVRLPAPVEPYILRISINAGSVASKRGVLLTSYPIDGSPFDRTRFHKLPCVSPSSSWVTLSQGACSLPSDVSKSIQLDIAIAKAGVYEFYVEYEALDGSRVQGAPAYFNVDPILTIPPRSAIVSDSGVLNPEGGRVLPGEPEVFLPQDGLVIQSVVSKWMGTVDEWDPHLQVTAARGYNMLHFVPLQERGETNSPYSIFSQLDFSDDLFPQQLSTASKVTKMKQVLQEIKSKHGMLSLTDVVWNHTANNSAWLQEHPEAGYNVLNSPHLEAALELDRALYKFSLDIEKFYQLPSDIKSEEDLAQIIRVLQNKVLGSLRLWEYYVLHVSREKEAFCKVWSQGLPSPVQKPVPEASIAGTKNADVPELTIPEDLAALPRPEVVRLFQALCLPKHWNQLSSRYHAQVDLQSAVRFLSKLLSKTPSASNAKETAEHFASILDDLNVERYAMYDSDIQSILENCTSRVRYQRLEPHGPKLGKLTPELPLVDRFFTELPDNATTKKHDRRAMALANNGWIWNANPLEDFASSHSRAYLRREVIAWGDCVKLRYGSGPEDCPWLWEHMTAYTELLAELFAGFRIDNCHSTPIHVGERLLDAARRKNPNLYVCAELFTGSEEMDTYFVKRLGLNSLIREAMNGHDPKDMSRLLYIYGVGKPIGSMDSDCLTETSTVVFQGKEESCLITPLTGSRPHAFMMDCTHDNEAPTLKRTTEDAMSTGALVASAYCAVGSNKGYDDFYGKLLDVVSEARRYEVPKTPEAGVGGIKRLLNHLHTEMVLAGFTEGHLHQENDYIFAHRVHPATQKGYLILAHCAFHPGSKDRGYISPIKLDGQKAAFVYGVKVEVQSQEDPSDSTTLRGLPVSVVHLPPLPVEDHTNESGQFCQINIPEDFPPGSVAVFSTTATTLTATLDEFCVADAESAFSELDLIDLNVVLYRAGGEERDFTNGQDGSYNVPGMGELVYCGLEGWMFHLRHIMRYNDLGHPLCAHLREGSWAMDYVQGRLQKQAAELPRLATPADWFHRRFEAIKKQAPPFLRPKYFAMVINTAYKAARDRALEQMSPFVRRAHRFTHSLALVSVQMLGIVKSASLDPFETKACLAAGLPHFTSGWARSWGRDVCISLRGLLLVTGQFQSAREHILAFATTVKHGLIPNLLDSIKTPRYNSRDSPFWYLQNIQDYAKIAPEGEALLHVSVKRRFPADDHWVPYDSPEAYAYTSTVAEVVQEILQRHASGIHFREYNAGPNLDSQMSDAGFNIDIEVDWNTGFILGGNDFNCGTWMDKMGESERAGTKGLPGTSRDGAPVEITGLLASALRWLGELSERGAFPFKGVEAQVQGSKKFITYATWHALLQANFEKQYYVPQEAKDDASYHLDPALVARRGIYKDVVGSSGSHPFSDYQLRCNFPVAMAVAPELFDPAHARAALKIYHQVLWGPLGVATLDPQDLQYRPYYDNANDSADPAVAKGRNYHQGPEWGWPGGYFLRAFLHFEQQASGSAHDIDTTLHAIFGMLSGRREHLRKDIWAGLPELTNKDGEFCRDSCTTQAWSASTILDALYDIQQSQT